MFTLLAETQQQSGDDGFAWFLLFCFAMFCMGIWKSLELLFGDGTSPPPASSKPIGLTCKCGTKATHFVTMNGIDTPVCADHAQEMMSNVG